MLAFLFFPTLYLSNILPFTLYLPNKKPPPPPPRQIRDVAFRNPLRLLGLREDDVHEAPTLSFCEQCGFRVAAPPQPSLAQVSER